MASIHFSAASSSVISPLAILSFRSVPRAFSSGASSFFAFFLLLCFSCFWASATATTASASDRSPFAICSLRSALSASNSSCVVILCGDFSQPVKMEKTPRRVGRMDLSRCIMGWEMRCLPRKLVVNKTLDRLEVRRSEAETGTNLLLFGLQSFPCLRIDLDINRFVGGSAKIDLGHFNNTQTCENGRDCNQGVGDGFNPLARLGVLPLELTTLV